LRTPRAKPPLQVKPTFYKCRMNERILMLGSSTTRRRCAVLFFACVAVLALSETRADGAVSLPDATGVFEQDLVTGVVELPGELGSGNTVLLVTGTLVPGTVHYCDRDGEFPRGSELHLYVGRGCNDFVVATGHLDLPAEAGEFTAEAPMLGLSGLPFDLSIVEGPTNFEFYVGYSPENTPVCESDLVPAVVTIATVELVSSESLPSDRPTWDAVKALYR